MSSRSESCDDESDRISFAKSLEIWLQGRSTELPHFLNAEQQP